MPLIVPNCGERELLKRIFNANPIPGDIYACLYCDNITPDDNTTLAMMEAAEVATHATSSDETGYVRQIIANTDWTISVSGNGIATAAEKVFALNGGIDGYAVYGYFVIVSNGTGLKELLWAEHFPVPFNIQGAPSGGEIRLILKLELN